MNYKSNKGLTRITLIISIIIILVILILGYNLLHDKSGVDIEKMLDNILTIHNISYEENSSYEKYLKKYLIKDNIQKITKLDESNNPIDVHIEDYESKTSTFYNEDDKTGKIASISPSEENITYIEEYVINSMKKYSYSISIENIDGKSYIVATVKQLKDQKYYDSLPEGIKKNSYIAGAKDLQKIYFDKETNLIVKIVYKDSYIEYKNIEVNIITDNDFIIPSDLQITDNRR